MVAKLQEQVALVLGGTGGLGAAVSRAFLQQGAKVIVSYRAQSEYDELAAAQGAVAGASLSGSHTDVTDEAQMQRLAASIVAQHGRIDALINAVGGYSGGTKLWQSDSATLERMLSLNLRSAFSAVRAVMPIMLTQGYGSVVNVAAKAALEPPGGAGAYAASKAAAVALMQSLAVDVSHTGVRVNSVIPSIIDTAANRRAMPNADFSSWPKAEDIARVIVFLCSPDAKVINGAAIPVYG